MKPIDFSIRIICPSAVSLRITEYCTSQGIYIESHKTTKLPKDEWEVVITIPKNSDGLFISDIQKIITDYEENVERFSTLCHYLNNMFYSTSYEEDVATFKLLIS